MDVIYYGVGAEPAGAFDNANRGAERYAAARSDTTMNQPQHTGGSAIASPPATFLNRYAIPCSAFSACAVLIKKPSAAATARPDGNSIVNEEKSV